MIGDFAPQLVWLAISFVILYLLMSRVALPRIADVLEDRQSRIADDLDQAQQLKANAEKVIADYEAALSEARLKAQAMLAETVANANAAAEKRNAEVAERLNGEAEAAAGRIADAKSAAMAEVKSVATELAQAAAEKLIGDTVAEAEVAAAKSPFARIWESDGNENSGRLHYNIVDRLATLHGGALEFSSQKGKGTYATIILPAGQ